MKERGLDQLAAMSDAELVAQLVELLRQERRLTAAVLVHLGEVEARRIYLPAACSSMHKYCTRVLGMSEDRLHLSGVVLLAPHLSQENAASLVAEASGKSKAEIEILLARRAPRPDVPQRIELVAEQTRIEVARSGPVDREAQSGKARVAPLAPARFACAVTIGEATHRKLLRAQALLRHQVPSGDLAEVLDRALDALLDRVEGRKFGKAKAPRARKASAASLYVPHSVRRQVVARDGARCAFVG